MDNVDVFQGDDKQWYFHIKAKNGLVVASSEGYKDKRNALKGVAAVAAAFSVEPDPNDPDTPPAIAFAKSYAKLLAKWQPGLSSVVVQRNEVTLAEIVLRATDDGWRIIPPAAAPTEVEPASITGATPVVEKVTPHGRRRKANDA